DEVDRPLSPPEDLLREPTLDEPDVTSPRDESRLEELEPIFGHALVAACEDIDCGVTVLGPRVNAQMRLGDDDHAADAVRIEPMKYRVHEGRARRECRILHASTDGRDVVEDPSIAIEEFGEEVATQIAHLGASSGWALQFEFGSISAFRLTCCVRGGGSHARGTTDREAN